MTHEPTPTLSPPAGRGGRIASRRSGAMALARWIVVAMLCAARPSPPGARSIAPSPTFGQAMRLNPSHPAAFVHRGTVFPPGRLSPVHAGAPRRCASTRPTSMRCARARCRWPAPTSTRLRSRTTTAPPAAEGFRRDPPAALRVAEGHGPDERLLSARRRPERQRRTSRWSERTPAYACDRDTGPSLPLRTTVEAASAASAQDSVVLSGHWRMRVTAIPPVLRCRSGRQLRRHRPHRPKTPSS